jgi:hypothetical protein
MYRMAKSDVVKHLCDISGELFVAKLGWMLHCRVMTNGVSHIMYSESDVVKVHYD